MSTIARRRAAPGGVVPAVALAAAMAVAWAIAYPHTPDLAGQDYRVYLFDHLGWQPWDGNWYGGHHLPGYSLLFAPVAAALGLRVTAAVALLGSSVLFALLAGRHLGRGAMVASLLFAVCAAGDLWIGRITFALGVTLALAAALALSHDRALLGSGLAALCSAASPVAGLFVALAGVALLLAAQRRDGLALAVPALAVAIAMAVLFPEGGSQPFPATSLAAALTATVALVVLIPARERVLRVGAVLYLAAVVAAKVVPSPMGSNVSRLGVLLGAPLLAGLWLRGPRRGAAAAPLAALALLVWAVWGPVREVVKTSGDPSTGAAYYQPLSFFLSTHLGPRARIEVPFTRAHWETDYLARRFALARGWERQLDRRFDGSALSGPSYLAWLRALAVRYVALPDVALDGSSRGEAALIRSRPAFLVPVLSDAHWRVFAVAPAAPAARGAGGIIALRHTGFDVAAARPGAVDVQVRWSRYFVVTAGHACVQRGPGGWTRVIARAAGAVSVDARFSLERAVGAASCG